MADGGTAQQSHAQHESVSEGRSEKKDHCTFVSVIKVIVMAFTIEKSVLFLGLMTQKLQNADRYHKFFRPHFLDLWMVATFFW